MMCKIVPRVKIYIDFFFLCLYRDCSQNRKALTFCLLMYLISHLCHPLLHALVLCLLSGCRQRMATCYFTSFAEL